MKNWIRISIDPKDEQQKEMLIAELSEIGFDGFQEEEDHLLAFAEEGGVKDDELSCILSKHHITCSRKIIADENWNKKWEKEFRPVRVGSFCGIRADFHEPIEQVKYELIINPKMSFGTGHHPSTCLMIEAMERLNFKGKKVVDFGTGTGILAILSEKLGAIDVVAVDSDSWSIENALENLLRNHSHYITILQLNSMQSGLEGMADIILANINKDVIINQLQHFQQHLVEDGVLICSGLLIGDKEDIRRRGGELHLSVESVIEKENWICLMLKKKSKSTAFV